MKVNRLLRIEEAAVRRGESYQATRDAIARGELRAVRVGVRGVRIPESELSRACTKAFKKVQEPTEEASR
jgi:excisionase family DNA binding protein